MQLHAQLNVIQIKWKVFPQKVFQQIYCPRHTWNYNNYGGKCDRIAGKIEPYPKINN